MQRHCRMDKKKNLQCCKHSFKPTIHVHLLQAKVFHTDTSDTQSKGWIDYGTICLLHMFGQYKK